MKICYLTNREHRHGCFPAKLAIFFKTFLERFPIDFLHTKWARDETLTYLFHVITIIYFFMYINACKYWN